jgi:hypothetical protein
VARHAFPDHLAKLQLRHRLGLGEAVRHAHVAALPRQAGRGSAACVPPR